MSRREKRASKKQAPDTATAATDDGFPDWPASAGKGGRAKALGVRWTLAVLALLAIVVLILRGFSPVQQTVNNTYTTSGVSTVGEYAAAFARDWFTWDEERRDDREARLTVYNPSLAVAGWDGQGVQRVIDARPFSQEEVDDTTTRVTVRVVVDSSPGAFYVDVLTAAAPGAYGVQSVPTVVPAPNLVPLANAPEEVTNTEQDTAVTAQITEALNNFFDAWVTGERLGQFVRDASSFAPLGGGMTYDRITNLVVPALEEGADPTARTVTANVDWIWPSGGKAPATYEVAIVQEAGKWFVDSISGGVPDPSIAPRDPQSPVTGAADDV